MKNRIEKSRASAATKSSSKIVTLKLRVRISDERWETFFRRAHHLSLTMDQLASAMLDVNMEGDEGNSFEEVGYHLMHSAVDLYPERNKVLKPLRDAFVLSIEASDRLFDARRKAASL